MMKSFKTLALIGVAAVTIQLTGCPNDELKCYAGGLKPEACNLYIAQPTTAAPMDKSVVILGDSLWDYGSPHGAIPRHLIKLSSKTYFELARSGAHTDYILKTEIPELENSVNGLTPRTVLVNGAANNVRTPCKSDPVNNVNMTSFTTECNAAFEQGMLEVEQIVTKLGAVGTVENIMWVGPERFPNTVVSDTLISNAVSRLKSICGKNTKCHYVDLSTLWTSAEASNYLFDSEHVNTAGAELAGNKIWSGLEQVGAYR